MAQTLTWVVQYTMDAKWARDGFDLTAERALAWIEEDLNPSYPRLLTATILERPPAEVLQELWSPAPRVRELGLMSAHPSAAVLEAAGADAATHEVLTWPYRSDIAAAYRQGRVVARFKVRSGDPECVVVRR